MSQCTIEGCGSPRRQSGWCHRHYTRWCAHGDPLWSPPPPASSLQCSLDDCDRMASTLASGDALCLKHYRRWQRNGDPSIVLVDRDGGGVCSIEECGKPLEARRMCAMHYQRWRKTGDAGEATPSKQRPWTERFESYVDRGGPAPTWRPDLDGCWVWTGPKQTSGHGQLRVDGALKMVHRLAYEMWVGVIDDGSQVDHLCRTRDCVNPQHLELVAMEENSRRARECARCLYLSECSGCGHDLSGLVPPPEITRLRRVGRRPATVSALDWFWSHINQGGRSSSFSPDEAPCWDWLGNTDGYGYGLLSSDSGTGPHRFSYELHVGPIESGRVIDHLCRNRLCVRPSHLEQVTRAENSRRGRTCPRCPLLTTCPHCSTTLP